MFPKLSKITLKNSCKVIFQKHFHFLPKGSCSPIKVFSIYFSVKQFIFSTHSELYKWGVLFDC